MSRRLGRELALKVLYQVDLVGAAPERALEDLCRDEEVPSDSAEFARQLVAGVLGRQGEIDALIARYAREWSLTRMAVVDRNILRLGVFQILHRPDIPASVAINEAVELAKRYGEAESGRFVNGILGQLVRDREGAAADRQETAALGCCGGDDPSVGG